MTYHYKAGVIVPFIKKFQKQLIIAVAAIFMASMAMMTLTTRAATTVVVYGDDLAAEGWEQHTTTGGSVTFENSVDAPLGNGVAKLVTSNDNDSRAQLRKNITSVSLADVDEVAYKSKVDSASCDCGSVSFFLTLDIDGSDVTTDDRVSIVHEPYWQNADSPDAAPVVHGIWQTWDVDQGRFWANNTISGFTAAGGGPSSFSLDDAKSNAPNATVVRIGAYIGSYNPEYVTYVDAVVFNGTEYNFEVTEPTITEVDVYGDSGALNVKGAWNFNRDPANATPIEFNSDEAKIGNGALYVKPLSNVASKKFIGEYFVHESLDNIDTLSYDFLVGSGGDSADANQFYMNVYVNWNNDFTSYGDCVYNIVPSAALGWTTVTFNPNNPATANSVRTRVQGPGGIACPLDPAQLPSTATVRMMAMNLGDTSVDDAGLDGHFDNAIVVLANGDTTIYDLEPYPAVTNKDECKNGGWMNGLSYTNQDAFKNQGDCVSYFATKFKNPPAGGTTSEAANARRR